MDNILDRISQIAENEGKSITALEKEIGASKGVLSRALANKSDIQSKWIQSIVEKYQQYDAGWLITGKGKMLKTVNGVLNTGTVGGAVVSGNNNNVKSGDISNNNSTTTGSYNNGNQADTGEVQRLQAKIEQLQQIILEKDKMLQAKDEQLLKAVDLLIKK